MVAHCARAKSYIFFDLPFIFVLVLLVLYVLSIGKLSLFSVLKIILVNIKQINTESF